MMNSDEADARANLSRLKAYLEQDPGNPSLRQAVFDAAFELGHWDLAQTQLEHALALTPDAPLWRHNLALLQLARHDYSGAESTLRRLVSHGHAAPALHYNLAWSLYRQEKCAQALSIAQPLLDDAEAPPSTLALCLRCLHADGRIEEGLQLFRQHEASRRPGADACSCASLMALDGEDFEAAHRWAEQALSSDPSLHEALVTRGSLAIGWQDVACARQALEAAMQNHGEDGRTWSALAMLHLLTCQFEEARTAFIQALRFMAGHIGTWHGLAWCEILLNNLTAARQAFEQALTLDRNFGESHGGLAVVQALQGDGPGADASIARALGLDRTSLSARYAQAIRSGEVRQQDALWRLAERLLKNRSGVDGKPLLENLFASERVSRLLKAEDQA